jgi:hypothetical protein
MALAEEIRKLRDRALAELNRAHDYYTDTMIAWVIVDQFVAAGNTFTINNTATGTRTTQTDLAGKAQGYVAQHLAEATFQQFISIFENFFFDFLRLWLLAYPQNLSRKTVEFNVVLDAPDKDAIILHVVNRKVNEALYERPAEWFKYLEELVKLGCPTPDEIGRIGEAKVSRDVLAHNRGVANKTCRRPGAGPTISRGTPSGADAQSTMSGPRSSRTPKGSPGFGSGTRTAAGRPSYRTAPRRSY